MATPATPCTVWGPHPETSARVRHILVRVENITRAVFACGIATMFWTVNPRSLPWDAQPMGVWDYLKAPWCEVCAKHPGRQMSLFGGAS